MVIIIVDTGIINSYLMRTSYGSSIMRNTSKIRWFLYSFRRQRRLNFNSFFRCRGLTLSNNNLLLFNNFPGTITLSNNDRRWLLLLLEWFLIRLNGLCLGSRITLFLIQNVFIRVNFLFHFGYFFVLLF